MTGKPKYRARPTTIDGHRFPSQLEAKRYMQLKLLKQAGKIRDFSLQPSFPLVDAFKRNGKVVRAITYVADFRVEHNSGKIVIEDSKGFETPVFKIKRKLFWMRYPDIDLQVVK